MKLMKILKKFTILIILFKKESSYDKNIRC